MSLPELYELQHCLVHVADVVACAIIKRQQPAADLVTKRALYREFGRGWVDKHIAPRGKIEGTEFTDQIQPHGIRRPARSRTFATRRNHWQIRTAGAAKISRFAAFTVPDDRTHGNSTKVEKTANSIKITCKHSNTHQGR